MSSSRMRALVQNENDRDFTDCFRLCLKKTTGEKSINVSNKAPTRYDLLSGRNCEYKKVFASPRISKKKN